MKYKKKIIWIIIIAVIVFGGYKFFSAKKPTTVYTTEEVVRGDLKQIVSSTGELNSDQSTSLSFKSSGRIESMNVEVGDLVTKGQRLAVIEKGILNEQLRQAEADIQTQTKTLNNMKHKDAYSDQQRDAQRAVIQKTQASRDSVLRQINDTTMIAPMDGIVTERKLTVGENAVANSPIITISDPTNLIIESNISETDITKVALEQKAMIVFDALTDKDIFVASVIEIDPASTVIQDVVYYRVKLKLANVDARLKIGMSCDVDILTAQVDNVLMIPQRAIKNEDTKKYVEILQSDGITIEKVFVETGLSGDSGMIEVLNNLKVGEKVVTFTKTQ